MAESKDRSWWWVAVLAVALVVGILLWMSLAGHAGEVGDFLILLCLQVPFMGGFPLWVIIWSARRFSKESRYDISSLMLFVGALLGIGCTIGWAILYGENWYVSPLIMLGIIAWLGIVGFFLLCVTKPRFENSGR